MIDGPKVPRGTLPTQSQIQALGSSYPKLEQYAQILSQYGVELGLIGPREVERRSEEHTSELQSH